MLGVDVTNSILFTHAMFGNNTTSRVLGVGKGVLLRLVQEINHFRVQASVFQKQSASKDEIAAAGERAMILIYNGGETDFLNDLRLKHFRAMVTDRKMAIHPRNLPPMSSSAMFHSFRVYH